MLLWFVAKDNLGRGWPVYLCHPDDCDGYQGITTGLKGHAPEEPRRVLINAAYSRDNRRRTALHELSHVAADGNPFSEHAEEEFVRLIERPLYCLLTSACGMKWPRQPRGTAALERRSKGKH